MPAERRAEYPMAGPGRAAPKTEPAANRTPHWRDKTRDPIGSDGKGGIRIKRPRPGGR